MILHKYCICWQALAFKCSQVPICSALSIVCVALSFWFFSQTDNIARHTQRVENIGNFATKPRLQWRQREVAWVWFHWSAPIKVGFKRSQLPTSSNMQNWNKVSFNVQIIWSHSWLLLNSCSLHFSRKTRVVNLWCLFKATPNVWRVNNLQKLI